jgi:HK97 family phage prohead protease
MSESLVRKNCLTVLKSANEEGMVEAFVSVYNLKDSHGERMRYGCYGESLAKKMPKVAYFHNWSELVGKVVEAREIPAGDPSLPESIREFGGLFVKCQFSMDVQKAKETFALIRDGVLDEWSVGYYEKGREIEGEDYWVTATDLVEVSPVLRGSNPATSTVSVKASGAPFADELGSVREAVSKLVTRSKEVAELRKSKGGAFSPENLELLKQMREEIDGFIADNDQKQEPEAPDADAQLALAAVAEAVLALS